jgi:Tol biopolymer transport system component
VTLSGQFKLSPDGRKLAFVATSQSKQQIWVRPIDSFTAEPLPSTEGDLGLGTIFWSGDSRSIAYFTGGGGQLKRVAATGGPSQLICNLKPGGIYFGTWNADGVILLGVLRQGGGGPLLRVSASGGEPVPVGEPDAARKEVGLGFPAFLPDGRHYFYSAIGPGVANGYIGTLDSKDRYALPGIAAPAQVSSSGHIFFVRDGGLMAQNFDLKRFQLSGEAFPISDASAPVTQLSALNLPPDLTNFLFTSVSSSGSLAYVRGRATGNAQGTQLMWYDRKGTPLGPAGPIGEYRNPDITPDGRLIAFSRGRNPSNIYVLDTQKGVTTHVTTGMANDVFPVWAPDERTIVFTSNRDGTRSLYTRVYDAVGEDKLLFKTQSTGPDGWSKNNYITYNSAAPQHIWAYSLTDSKATQVTFSEFQESGGRLSPDGHWLAYQALEQELGKSQLVIQSFPEPVGKRRFRPEEAP